MTSTDTNVGLCGCRNQDAKPGAASPAIHDFERLELLRELGEHLGVVLAC